MSERAQVVIVGAGPAGLVAAVSLAEAGVRSILLDDNARPGGQIFRTVPGDGPAPDYPDKDRRGEALRGALDENAGFIDYRPRHQVVAAHDDRRLWIHDETSGQVVDIVADCIVVASGAIEIPLPVRGWTLPGVYMLGGLQNLIKSAGMVPRGRVVLGGAGPLLYLVASQLARLGVAIAAVVDAAGLPTVGQAVGLTRQPRQLARGLAFEWSLRRRGIPLLRRHAIIGIDGRDSVTAATIARIDENWAPIKGSERTLPTDFVGLSFGLRPNIEVTQLLGCAHETVADLGGLVPSRSADMETSQAGVFAVGDGAGIGGVDVALAEGLIASAAIAGRLGAEIPKSLGREVALARRLLKIDRPFHNALARWSAIRPGILSALADETIVCRCEDVSAGAIRAALGEGLTHPGPLKMRTRAGMGLCQGRVCGGAVRAMIAAHLGVSESEVPAPTVRIPLRPVPAAAFSELPIAPDAA